MRTKTGILTVALVACAAATVWANSKTVPSGTEIAIRTSGAIDSKTAQPGQTFAAVVDRDVMDASGSLEIPKGSEAQLVIRKVSSGGTFGGSELALDLESLTIGGKRYTVGASDWERSNNKGLGKNRRTAEMTGGGALLGTLLGAVAGGGKGALIGALTGAAAGGTVQVLTKGKEVRVPAESVLTFRLNQPLHLQAH
jgi:hypothetical protein